MSDRNAIGELRNARGEDRETVVVHYVYFPTKDTAEVAVASLKDEGFAIESRLGADGINWLVLASHRIVPNEAEIERHRVMLEAIALQGNGEYDGWEAAT